MSNDALTAIAAEITTLFKYFPELREMVRGRETKKGNGTVTRESVASKMKKAWTEKTANGKPATVPRSRKKVHWTKRPENRAKVRRAVKAMMRAKAMKAVGEA